MLIPASVRRKVGERLVATGRRLLLPRPAAPTASVDEQPWRHPYLTTENLRRFRAFSEGVWEVALAHAAASERPLRCAFSVNMNQSMYKWARLAKQHGADVELFLNPMDGTAINLPAWEDYDGEFDDVLDGERFERSLRQPHVPGVRCRRTALDGADFLTCVQAFVAGDRRPLLALLAGTPGLRHEVLVGHTACYPYYEWARAMADFDVVYAASHAFAAYASGRPYCVFSVGGDLIYDCGRGDDYGAAAVLSFNAARFLTLTNPHPLAHCRRLGLTNAVYLPYPMDDDRYSPGPGIARAEWRERSGGEVFVLGTARLDTKWKGQGEDLLAALATVARHCTAVRFVFLAWGESASQFRERLQASDVKDRCLLLPPVGKQRLIDYYRSADVVLDQMVLGYCGATALEAAAVGRPVVMRLRTEHYDPLYRGDVAPVVPVTPAELGEALTALVRDREGREDRGRAMRAWLVRNHGAQRAVPRMLALLRLAADRVPLPHDLVSPLLDPLGEAERRYHAACATTS